MNRCGASYSSWRRPKVLMACFGRDRRPGQAARTGGRGALPRRGTAVGSPVARQGRQHNYLLPSCAMLLWFHTRLTSSSVEYPGGKPQKPPRLAGIFSGLRSFGPLNGDASCRIDAGRRRVFPFPGRMTTFPLKKWLFSRVVFIFVEWWLFPN